MDATLKIENDKGDTITSDIHNDLDQPNLLGVIPRLWELPSIRIELEKATIYYYNFMMPHLYMYVAITDKTTGSTTYQKHYNYGPKWKTTGETWWSTYRYMLEAFVDKCKGKEPVHWVPGEDSIAQMQVIDDVYTKSGLGRRPGSVVPA
jgi:hypothetical protein